MIVTALGIVIEIVMQNMTKMICNKANHMLVYHHETVTCVKFCHIFQCPYFFTLTVLMLLFSIFCFVMFMFSSAFFVTKVLKWKI